MTELTLERLREELAPVRDELARVRAQLDGLPIVNRRLGVIQHDMRTLTAAFNDFAKTNVTSGEVEALHTDVDRVQADNLELERRIATVERLLDELRSRS